jgi:hypothetical protein
MGVKINFMVQTVVILLKAYCGYSELALSGE